MSISSQPSPRPLRALVCSTGRAARFISAVLAASSDWEVTQLSLSEARGNAYSAELDRRGALVVHVPGGKATVPAAAAAAAKGVAHTSASTKEIVASHTSLPVIVASASQPSATAVAAARAADLAIFAMPAFGHTAYMRAVLPHLRAGTAVLVLPAYAHTDLLARAIWAEHAATPSSTLRLFLARELPWVIRDEGDAGGMGGFDVRLLAEKRHILLCGLQLRGNGALRGLEHAAADGDHTSSWNLPLRFLSDTFSGAVNKRAGAGAALSLAVFNPNAQMHVCLQRAFVACADSPGYGRNVFTAAEAGSWELYAGVTAQGAALLDAVGAEAVRVGDALEAAWGSCKRESEVSDAGSADLHVVVQHFGDWVRETYADHVSDGSTTLSAMQTNKAFKRFLHPMQKRPDGLFEYCYDTRFVTEDVSFGLLPLKGLAQLVGCRTPALDETLRWAQSIMSTSLVCRDGELSEQVQSGEGCGRIVQQFGVKNVDDLMNIYNRIEEK